MRQFHYTVHTEKLRVTVIMSVDSGLCISNYFDYTSDDIAIQAEHDIVTDVIHSEKSLRDDLDQSISWKDPDFPANSNSLYINPMNPSKGNIHGKQLRWCRISTYGNDIKTTLVCVLFYF